MFLKKKLEPRLKVPFEIKNQATSVWMYIKNKEILVYMSF